MNALHGRKYNEEPEQTIENIPDQNENILEEKEEVNDQPKEPDNYSEHVSKPKKSFLDRFADKLKDFLDNAE
jgi:hypothetical protein